MRAFDLSILSLQLALGSTSLVLLGCGSSSDPNQSDSNAGTSGSDVGSSGGEQASGTAGAAGSAGSGRDDGGGSGSESTTPVLDHALACTGAGACALDKSQKIRCWGFAPKVWTIPDGEFVELRASVDSFCAVRADRTVSCFDPPSGNLTSIASMMPTGKVQALELGLGTICGVDDGGSPFCKSDYLGLSVPAGASVDQFSIGYQFVCGIRKADSSILCWGDGGDPTCSLATGIPAVGQLVPPSGAFTRISSGIYSSCALDAVGGVSCWGAGKSGTDPALECQGQRYNFGQSASPKGAFRAIAVGQNHTCGIKTDGTLACWGAGTADTDCPGDSVDCRQSRPPAGSFVQVSVGRVHSCAITADRKVKCWGYPGAGAGDGRLTPPVEFQ